MLLQCRKEIEWRGQADLECMLRILEVEPTIGDFKPL